MSLFVLNEYETILKSVLSRIQKVVFSILPATQRLFLLKEPSARFFPFTIHSAVHIPDPRPDPVRIPSDFKDSRPVFHALGTVSAIPGFATESQMDAVVSAEVVVVVVMAGRYPFHSGLLTEGREETRVHGPTAHVFAAVAVVREVVGQFHVLVHGDVHEQETPPFRRVILPYFETLLPQPLDLIGSHTVVPFDTHAVAVPAVKEPHPEDNVLALLVVNRQPIVESMRNVGCVRLCQTPWLVLPVLFTDLFPAEIAL